MSMTSATAKVLKSGAIVIKVSASLLKSAAERCPQLEFDDGIGLLRPKVRNVRAFARDVAVALNMEGEDGLSPIHRMFDQAFVDAIEDGAEGISTADAEDYGPKRYL